jgi:hypothetical protein
VDCRINTKMTIRHVCRVINEYIKSTVSLCIPLYLKLFNTILDTGIIPEIWTIGMSMYIYTNKGDRNNPGVCVAFVNDIVCCKLCLTRKVWRYLKCNEKP